VAPKGAKEDADAVVNKVIRGDRPEDVGGVIWLGGFILVNFEICPVSGHIQPWPEQYRILRLLSNFLVIAQSVPGVFYYFPGTLVRTTMLSYGLE
jgi:hypothetical protein